MHGRSDCIGWFLRLQPGLPMVVGAKVVVLRSDEPRLIVARANEQAKKDSSVRLDEMNAVPRARELIRHGSKASTFSCRLDVEWFGGMGSKKAIRSDGQGMSARTLL